MIDQAANLRNLVQSQSQSIVPLKNTKIIAVTSGKGGVGKSNFSLNFALSLKAQGYRVLVFDADIGMANIDVLMGVSSQYSLYHLLKREKTIWEIIQTGNEGLEYISGGSGFNDLVRLSEEELDYFVEQVDELNGHMDYIIFDTGAGLPKETLKFLIAAHQTIIVTTPEPTAITDAYSLIKVVHSMGHDVNFKLLVNRIIDLAEGQQTANKISIVSKKFLGVDIETLGYIEDDPLVSKAVKRQIPYTVAYPNSSASRSMRLMVTKFLMGSEMRAPEVSSGVKGFLGKMIKFLKV